MTYSMVNMPVLGFDLCRLPQGAAVAEVLLGAMLADDDGVERLSHAGARPGPPATVWAAVDGADTATTQLADQIRRLAPGSTSAALTDVPAVVAMLERSTLGSLDSLTRLVRDELFANRLLGHAESVPAARSMRAPYLAAVEVVADAVTAGYASQALAPATQQDLRRRWVDAAVHVPVHSSIDLGPQSMQVRAVLRTMINLDPPQVRALRRAVDADSVRRRAWATAMHEAAWAVHVTGRATAAAVAQLLTVRAFDRSPFTVQDASYGLWNAISGLVQGLVVEDVLSDEVLSTLQEFWIHAMDAAS